MKSVRVAPLRIYVAGPYTPKEGTLHDAARIAFQNTKKAMLIGNELIYKGHYPYVPHLSHFMQQDMDRDIGDKWYDIDNVWLDRCEALYYISPSWGADKELERAKKQGLQIFYHLDEVKQAHRDD